MLFSEREDTLMLKKTALTLAGIAMLAMPTVASARDRDDYGYGRDGRWRHDNHAWRERQREHEQQEWREHERRERQYYNGYYNNRYYNTPSYRNGYFDAYGYWHSYGW